MTKLSALSAHSFLHVILHTQTNGQMLHIHCNIKAAWLKNTLHIVSLALNIHVATEINLDLELKLQALMEK